MSDNSLLLAVALIERVKPQLQEDKRTQINRTGLNMISQAVSQALERLNKILGKDGNIYILGDLIVVLETVNNLLQEESFTETDLETKNMLTEKIAGVLSKLYMEAGRYYTNHDFDYSPRMVPILNRIIDACVEGGYYFEECLKGGE